MSIIKEQSFAEKLFWDLVSGILILLIMLLIKSLGFEGYVLQSFILLAISWIGFFLYPLFLFQKPLAILFVRFMKDTPMLFPTFFIVTLFEPLIFGAYETTVGGVSFTVFNESFFSIMFLVVVTFASNVHRIMGYLLKIDFFFYLMKKITFSRQPEEKTRALLNPNHRNYEKGLKWLTYNFLALQIAPVGLLSVFFLVIFQEVFPVPILQTFFGIIILFSCALMGMGVVRIICFGFETFVEKKYRVKVE